jgi:uncharacterized protein
MTTSFAERLLPSLQRGLCVLQEYLDKIEATAAATGASEWDFLDARLADDMLPFTAQVQRATDTAKGAVARLAGISPLWLPDTEGTVEALQVRLVRTMAFLRSVDASELEASDHFMVDQGFRGAHYAMRAHDYVDAYVLPNFYFHIAVAHAILRNRHVDVGKANYLGRIKGYAIGGPTLQQGRLRFLTTEQAAAWSIAYDLNGEQEPDVLEDGGTSFAADVASIAPTLLVSSILGPDRTSLTPAMVLFTAWIWDDEYETDPLAGFRLAQGETRPLSAVPGWVFPPDDGDDLSLVLSLAVERGWAASIYLTDRRTMVRLLDNARIEVHASEPDVARAIRLRLTGLGAFCGALESQHA